MNTVSVKLPTFSLKTAVMATGYMGNGFETTPANAGFLAAIQKKMKRGVFVVDGNLDRPTYKAIHTEASAAGLDTKLVYVFAETATYTGHGIEFIKLDDLPGEREFAAEFRFWRIRTAAIEHAYLQLKALLIEDMGSQTWLQEQIDYASSKRPNRFGVPFMGKITGRFTAPVNVPVSLLVKLLGQRGEQSNVRINDLEAIKNILSTTGKLPLCADGSMYVPYIEVAYNGEAWVSEGNYRIMAAAALGWKTLPVEIRYFDGGQRILSGPMSLTNIVMALS